MPAIAVKLGDFTFGAFEVPELIGVGGEQQNVVHELIGGGRAVDAMGQRPRELTWSGLFFGAGALDRARFVDQLRAAGNALDLTWSQFAYSVMIRSFHYDFVHAWRLPYTIALDVIEDRTLPARAAPALTFDAAILGDFNNAQDIAAQINDGPLSDVLDTLDSAIKAVSTFANAAQSVINTVLVPLQQVQSRVNVLITATGNTVINTTTFGGALATPGGLLNQSQNTGKLAQLYPLQSTLNRIGANLNLINRVPNAITVAVAGGTLFHLAAQYYGDATKWTEIAAANGTTDPIINGSQSLIIPPVQPTAAGGVLSL